MSDFWFKPKTTGYGASPIDWRGWAWIAAFGAFDLVSMYFMVLRPALDMTGPSAMLLIVWLILMAIATAVFLYICKIKTDGEWRWRSKSKL